MLSARDEKDIAAGFKVYEHEWRFFAGFMGEPFLLGDCLVYWDGQVANVCAFAISPEPRRIDSGTLTDILSRLPGADAIQLVHVWGDFDAPTTLSVAGHAFLSADPAAASEVHTGEHTIDIRRFRLGAWPEAAKAVRSSRNKGISVRSRQVAGFEADHFRLIEVWRRTRPIETIAACATSTLPSYCREQGVLLLEATIGQKMVGFAILTRPTASQAVLMWSFSEKAARIEDALTYAAIEQCVHNGVATLHCGYAGTASLARFKAKWSAVATGPSYRQAVFAKPGIWLDRAQRYEFYWAIRMLANDQRPVTGEPQYPI